MTDINQALARRTDPETSHAAAALVDVRGLELKVLEILSRDYGVVGLTVSDIAQIADFPRDSISPRMKRLDESMLVMLTNDKRIPLFRNTRDLNSGRRNSRQQVWIITQKGRDLLASKKLGVSQSESV